MRAVVAVLALVLHGVSAAHVSCGAEPLACPDGDIHDPDAYRPPGYTVTDDTNCGWDMSICPGPDCVTENNAHKYVCPQCTNSHKGVDVEGIDECKEICELASQSDCGGYTFWGPGILGADGVSHGASGGKLIGSCYFRNSDWMDKCSAKVGVYTYQRHLPPTPPPPSPPPPSLSPSPSLTSDALPTSLPPDATDEDEDDDDVDDEPSDDDGATKHQPPRSQRLAESLASHCSTLARSPQTHCRPLSPPTPQMTTTTTTTWGAMTRTQSSPPRKYAVGAPAAPGALSARFRGAPALRAA